MRPMRRPGLLASALILAHALARAGLSVAAPPAASPTVRGAPDWHQVQPDQRNHAQRSFDHYRALPAERQREMQQNWQRFQRLPQADRQRVLDNYRRYQQMTPDQRREFGERYRRWRQDEP